VIKGPQTVQYANTGSAATVIFERQPEKLTSEKPYRGQASVLLGSYGRLIIMLKRLLVMKNISV
jgi:iron complex outermembrane receptor protein